MLEAQSQILSAMLRRWSTWQNACLPIVVLLLMNMYTWYDCLRAIPLLTCGMGTTVVNSKCLCLAVSRARDLQCGIGTTNKRRVRNRRDAVCTT